MQVLRRIGIGDRDQVRTALFSVGCFGPITVAPAIAALEVSKRLHMMLRFHVDLAMPAQELKELRYLFLNYPNDQLMDNVVHTPKSYAKAISTCDIILQSPSDSLRVVGYEPDVQIGKLVESMLFAWNATRGREVYGNHFGSDTEWLRVKFPSMFAEVVTI